MEIVEKTPGRKNSLGRKSLISNPSEMMEMIPEDVEPAIESPAPIALPKFFNTRKRKMSEKKADKPLIIVEECEEDDEVKVMESERENLKGAEEKKE